MNTPFSIRQLNQVIRVMYPFRTKLRKVAWILLYYVMPCLTFSCRSVRFLECAERTETLAGTLCKSPYDFAGNFTGSRAGNHSRSDPDNLLHCLVFNGVVWFLLYENLLACRPIDNRSEKVGRVLVIQPSVDFFQHMVGMRIFRQRGADISPATTRSLLAGGIRIPQERTITVLNPVCSGRICAVYRIAFAISIRR